MRSNVSITKTTRGQVPRLPFEKMARVTLGNKYELSVVICGDRLAERMNKEYRKKSYKPNVLSFPLSKTEGEIFLNVRCAAREAKKYKTTLSKRLALLFVHGCFHLKGLKHGTKMEAAEQKTLRKFHL
jgi:probable rRNA maturation factor